MSRRACVGGKHDTRQLPPNGFMFAPGVIEGPSRRRWLTPSRRAYLELGAAAILMTLAAAAMCVALAGRL